MKPAPPKWVEVIVELLLPPACREHVLGDLHQRYSTLWRYALDALSAIPAVVFSRIRRTTDAQVLLLEAFVVYLSLIASAWLLEGGYYLHGPWVLLRLAIPAVAAVTGLMLTDAYARPEVRSPLKPFTGALLAIGCAFFLQGVLAAAKSPWTVPWAVIISAGAASLLLITTLRILFPANDNRPRGAT